MDSIVLIHSPFKCLRVAASSCATSIRWPKFSFSRLKKSSSVSVRAMNQLNSDFLWSNCGSLVKPISYIIPFVQKVSDYAVKSSTQKWAAVLHVQDTSFFQNDALPSALVAATGAAKVKISPFMATLAANPTFVSGLCAWAIAQSIKVLLNFWVERKWDIRIMFSSGGMPSSHSALCTALTTSVAICHGVADSLFPVCLWFSMIVMYDATGVRRHAGMQAEVLNLIVEDLFQWHPISQRKLKELLGHTPSQVFAGAMLGIVVAWVCCMICLSPVL